MERLDTPAQALSEARRADRHDHELLQIECVIGVHAAVDDVHHRHGQDVCVGAANLQVERHAIEGSGSMSAGERYAEDGVRAEAALVRRAVELDQGRVDRALVARLHALQLGGDLAVDVGHGLRDALAHPGIAAVTKLDGLPLSGGGAGGHSGGAARPALEDDVDLDRRVAAGIEDLAAVNRGDDAHRAPYRGQRASRSFAAR